MPVVLINGEDLWSAVNNSDNFDSWISTNVSASDILSIPGVMELVREHYNNEFIASMEDLYDVGEYREHGGYSLHVADVDDADATEDTPIAYARNPQSLIEVAKRVASGNYEDAHYFIFDHTGKEVGYIGEDESGQFMGYVY